MRQLCLDCFCLFLFIFYQVRHKIHRESVVFCAIEVRLDLTDLIAKVIFTWNYHHGNLRGAPPMPPPQEIRICFFQISLPFGMALFPEHRIMITIKILVFSAIDLEGKFENQDFNQYFFHAKS